MTNEQFKTCEYCHQDVSIFESLTEFGKHYHERCYIHKTGKDIEGYKKKWINGTLTNGDKVDLVDKYNLVEKLKTEKTIYKGEVPVFMRPIPSKKITEKVMLVQNKAGVPVLDADGKPVYVDEEVVLKEVSYYKSKPVVDQIKTGYKPKLLKSAEDILKLTDQENNGHG